eukprot:COSAG05_NODE_6099_length_1022_cov_1.248104_2_plen_99_part_01
MWQRQKVSRLGDPPRSARAPRNETNPRAVEVQPEHKRMVDIQRLSHRPYMKPVSLYLERDFGTRVAPEQAERRNPPTHRAGGVEGLNHKTPAIHPGKRG